MCVWFCIIPNKNSKQDDHGYLPHDANCWKTDTNVCIFLSVTHRPEALSSTHRRCFADPFKKCQRVWVCKESKGAQLSCALCKCRKGQSILTLKFKGVYLHDTPTSTPTSLPTECTVLFQWLFFLCLSISSFNTNAKRKDVIKYSFNMITKCILGHFHAKLFSFFILFFCCRF